MPLIRLERTEQDCSFIGVRRRLRRERGTKKRCTDGFAVYRCGSPQQRGTGKNICKLASITWPIVLAQPRQPIRRHDTR
jgi:hypothetical protein